MPFHQEATDYFRTDFYEPFQASLTHLVQDLQEFNFETFHQDYVQLDKIVEAMENFVLGYNSVNFPNSYIILVQGGIPGPYDVVAESVEVEFPNWLEILPFHSQDFVKLQIERIISVYNDFANSGNFNSFWLQKPMLKHSVYMLKCMYMEYDPRAIDMDSGVNSPGSQEANESSNDEDDQVQNEQNGYEEVLPPGEDA